MWKLASDDVKQAKPTLTTGLIMKLETARNAKGASAIDPSVFATAEEALCHSNTLFVNLGSSKSR